MFCVFLFFYAQIYFSYVLANFPKIENILAFRGKFFFGVQDKKKHQNFTIFVHKMFAGYIVL